MENKNELTEKLKVLELKVHNSKTDLNAINSKLDIAYQYEEDLVKRQIFAKAETEILRQDFFKKSSEIAKLHEEMKHELEIYTGGFY